MVKPEYEFYASFFVLLLTSVHNDKKARSLLRVTLRPSLFVYLLWLLCFTPPELRLVIIYKLPQISALDLFPFNSSQPTDSWVQFLPSALKRASGGDLSGC